MRSKIEKAMFDAAVGDLIIALDGTNIAAIEAVSDGRTSGEIIDRWIAQHVIGPDDVVQVWEARAGFHFRRRGGPA